MKEGRSNHEHIFDARRELRKNISNFRSPSGRDRPLVLSLFLSVAGREFLGEISRFNIPLVDFPSPLLSLPFKRGDIDVTSMTTNCNLSDTDANLPC